MGAAQSSNTSESVAKIANSVSSNTSTTNNQVVSAKNEVEFNDCNIGKDVNINIAHQFVAKSRQIVSAFQQTNIQNMIAQQMQQEAQSTVGGLGLGYSDASNYASTFASATNDVVNMVYTYSSQAAFYNTTVQCDGSTVGGSFNINIKTANNFWNDQGVTSNQVTDISNNIDQKISQTAKSKVEGLGGFLIALIALIGAFIYAIAAPVGESLSSLKVSLAVFMLFGILLLVIRLWLIEWSPFFSTLKTCVASGTLLKGQCTPQNCKIKDTNPKNINLDHPPLKYLHGLIARGAPRSDSAYGMLNMMIFGQQIVQNVNMFNQGFNAAQYWTFADVNTPDLWKGDNSYEGYGVSQLPNPLYVPTGKDDDGDDIVYLIPPQYVTQNPDKPTDDDAGSLTPSVYMGGGKEIGMKKTKYDQAVKDKDNGTLMQVLAILNDSGWQKYFDSGSEDVQRKNKLHARFILALNLGIDVNVYIYDDEEVLINNVVMLAKNSEGKAYKFSNFRSPPFNDISFGIKGSGTLTGVVGICDSRSNNLIKFFTSGGNYMMLIILIIVFGALIWFSIRRKK
jgi:hypothetical protein